MIYRRILDHVECSTRHQSIYLSQRLEVWKSGSLLKGTPCMYSLRAFLNTNVVSFSGKKEYECISSLFSFPKDMSCLIHKAHFQQSFCVILFTLCFIRKSLMEFCMHMLILEIPIFYCCDLIARFYEHNNVSPFFGFWFLGYLSTAS